MSASGVVPQEAEDILKRALEAAEAREGTAQKIAKDMYIQMQGKRYRLHQRARGTPPHSKVKPSA